MQTAKMRGLVKARHGEQTKWVSTYGKAPPCHTNILHRGGFASTPTAGEAMPRDASAASGPGKGVGQRPGRKTTEAGQTTIPAQRMREGNWFSPVSGREFAESESGCL